MKKLVLIVVWLLLIAVFVVLNYLIWDRENKEKDIESLESLNASNSSSIAALGREINNLETEKKRMESEIFDLKKKISDLEDANKKIEEDNKKNLEIIQRKNETIYTLIQQSGTKDIEKAIINWVDSINAGNYDEAYKLIRLRPSSNQVLMSPKEFADNYKNSIKSIKIESMEFLPEDILDNKKGDIVFKVQFIIEKSEGFDRSFTDFSEGLNERYITVDYSKEMEQWMISGIFTAY
ncbi:MAG TPA: hypothetical protein GXX20_11360 [Clostridiaceae bacterium]|nr:hypothetical protein [Clostridiaceae bacterium]